MAPTQPKVRSTAEWTAILNRIQADVTRSLAETPEPAPLPPPADPAALVHAPLTALDDRMKALQAVLDRAAQCAADSDALLHAASETLRTWNKKIEQIREKLANWVTRVV